VDGVKARQILQAPSYADSEASRRYESRPLAISRHNPGVQITGIKFTPRVNVALLLGMAVVDM